MQRSRIHLAFSFAIGLLDAFTGKPAVDSSLNVGVVGVPRKAVRKQDGLYVFTDLPAGAYQIRIRSRLFFDRTISLSAGERISVVWIALLPRTSYLYPPQTTGIRLKVVDRLGRGQPLVSIKAALSSRESQVARIVHPMKRGEAEGKVTGKISLISPGDCLLLASPVLGQEEYVAVRDKDDEEGWLALCEPLRHGYEKGAVLYLVSQGITDETGEAILGFRQFTARKSAIRLTLERDGQTGWQQLQSTIAEGSFQNLGNICFSLKI